MKQGKILNETFAKRQFTDYDIDANISKEEAEEVLENTAIFIDEIIALLNKE